MIHLVSQICMCGVFIPTTILYAEFTTASISAVAMMGNLELLGLKVIFITYGSASQNFSTYTIQLKMKSYIRHLLYYSNDRRFTIPIEKFKELVMLNEPYG